MNFRLRYTILFIFCIVLLVWNIFQQTQLYNLNETINTIKETHPTWSQMKQRAVYINNRLNDIDYTVSEIEIGIENRNDYLNQIHHGKSDMYEWVVGMTTNEIDSVLRTKEVYQ